MHPSEPPDHAADHPRPAQPTLPHKAVRGVQARSSQLHLHIARRRQAADPVTGVTGEVLRLRFAVGEVVGDVLHDVHRLGAAHRLSQRRPQ
jgi:hypothetical protein